MQAPMDITTWLNEQYPVAPNHTITIIEDSMPIINFCTQHAKPGRSELFQRPWKV